MTRSRRAVSSRGSARPPRRGLTLLEVLAATVLLSTLVVACLPWLQLATETRRELVPLVPVDAFHAFAGLIAADPAAHGVVPGTSSNVPWPEEPTWPAVTCRYLLPRDQAEPSDDAPVESPVESPVGPPLEGAEPHAWLQLECAAWRAFRRVEIPRTPAAAAPGGDE